MLCRLWVQALAFLASLPRQCLQPLLRQSLHQQTLLPPLPLQCRVLLLLLLSRAVVLAVAVAVVQGLAWQQPQVEGQGEEEVLQAVKLQGYVSWG